MDIFEKQLELTKRECVRFLEKIEKYKEERKEKEKNDLEYKLSSKTFYEWDFVYPNKEELYRACVDARREIMNLSKKLK